MKHQGNRRQATRSIDHASTADPAEGSSFPPPHSSTRVAFDLAPPSATATGSSKPSVSGVGHRRIPAARIVAIALGGAIVVVCSTIVGEAGVVDVPPSFEIAAAGAGAGAALLAAGGIRGWRRWHARERVLRPVLRLSTARVDLPTITGQMSGVLAALRHEHGLAYTSRTWIQAVLPRYTSTAFADPGLARDLLATAVLDAGGIRADVSTIAASYSRTVIVETCVALLGALEAVQIACESATGELPQPQPSDPTGWPAEMR